MAQARDDDRLMSLVDQALERPPAGREAFLRDLCSGDDELFTQAASCIRWEENIRGLLTASIDNVLAEERPFAAGELLNGRFRIVREVAEGGMGIVYEAMDEKLGRRIALKRALTGFGARLTPEALHAGEISHPNVCRTFEIHTASVGAGEVEFLTMEYVAGETLTERLRRATVPPDEAGQIAAGIARGLAEAHRHHVVHGDLKANNIILGTAPEGGVRPVITDFGMARGRRAPSHPDGRQSEAGGTPEYMAPELWTGAKPSTASDVYAFGVILYELATGRRPSSGRSATHENPAPSHSKWDRIIARCLASDPRERYADAGEVARSLEPSRAWRWWLGAVAAIAMAVISGVVVQQRATAPRESIRLAVAPFEAGAGESGVAARVSRDASAILRRITGGNRARFSLVSAPRATHLLHGSVTSDGEALILHVLLTDTRTQANNAERTFRYTSAEVGYAPEALAGVVTAALRLPPIAPQPVNGAAQHDYADGLAEARRNSTIDRALSSLQRAVREDPDSPLTWAGLALAQWQKYFATRNPQWLELCTGALAEAQRRNPDVAPVHLMAGRLAANDGFFEQAEGEYLRSIELDPANADAHRRLGQVYLQNGRLDQARTEFLKAVEVEPGYFTACQDLGAFYQNRGDLKAAAIQFERCVQLAPAEPDAHRVLALVYRNLGRYSDAEREYRAGVALAETPDALVALGIDLMYQGRDREALPYLQRAVRLSPSQSLLWMDLGNAWRRTDSPGQARAAWRRGLKKAEEELARDPRDADAESRLAFLCARLGQRDRAASEIARALRLSPDSGDIREAAVWTWEVLAKRDEALVILSSSSDQVLNDVRQWPDLAGLRRDSRFTQLLALHRIQSGEINAR